MSVRRGEEEWSEWREEMEEGKGSSGVGWGSEGGGVRGGGVRGGGVRGGRVRDGEEEVIGGWKGGKR